MVRVLIFPLNREAYYQQPLYREVVVQGVGVQYLATRTPSQTLNLLLIPISLAWHRLRGFKILHIHWVYTFCTTWSLSVPFGRLITQYWFNICLTAARILGIKVVWTAHNILPHDRVFYDDVAARIRLTRAADAVIAHQEVAVAKLKLLGARNVHVIAAGPYTDEYKRGMGRIEARRILEIDPDDRVVLFVGNIAPYKQVDWLIEAAGRMPMDDDHLRVVVAGACQNDELRNCLEKLAIDAGPRVIARFGYIPDDDLQLYFACADVVALPFARVTNSASAILALSFGVPLLLPNLPELSYLPDTVAIRYEPRLEALVEALAQVSAADPNVFSELSIGGRKFLDTLSWEKSGRATVDLYHELLLGN